MRDHCCDCERSKRRNRLVFIAIVIMAVVTTLISAVSFVRYNWLAFSGWILWTVTMMSSLTFSDGWRMWCIEHESKGHLR